MHIEFLVEEISMRMALENIVPKIIGEEHSFQIHNFRSKQDLLKKLGERLRAYSRLRVSWEFKIVVLLDEDRQDCKALKQTMVNAAKSAGVDDIILHRIVVEELEAWFIGDVNALRQVFPKIPETISAKVNFRKPDQILGGTWETLDKLLLQYGYNTGLIKTEAAKEISKFMDIGKNRSPSFNSFKDGLLKLIS
ncbi:MAG: hypothetical protein VR68_01330 [Peptococcaceae bacterium BRH_c4a]|nr:MAG: hypothetical protein VR68_01330 [Peptococcaceae bacterium BRH_c4a]